MMYFIYIFHTSPLFRGTYLLSYILLPSEECTLHLDLFLAELKRLPVLHDTAASDVSLEDRGYSVAERLAMP